MPKARAIRDAEEILLMWESDQLDGSTKVTSLCARAPRVLRDLIKLHARKSARRRVRCG